MSIAETLLPLFVQVILTFVLGICMGWMRWSSVRRGEVRLQDVALREPKWTSRTLQFAYSFQNQFELPVLFYVLTILVLITQTKDFNFVTLSWIFVALRIFHAYIHVTFNNVRTRGGVFMLGAIVLMIMWGMFMLRIEMVH